MAIATLQSSQTAESAMISAAASEQSGSDRETVADYHTKVAFQWHLPQGCERVSQALYELSRSHAFDNQTEHMLRWVQY